MMLIPSIIVIRWYLFSACLLSRVLKNINFKEHLSGAGSKYSLCNIENRIQYCLVYSPNGNGMVLWKIVFWSGNHYGKRWKQNILKDAMWTKISFMFCLHEVGNSIVTSRFQGIWSDLYFFCYFFLFTIIVNWYKLVNWYNQPSSFYGPVLIISSKNINTLHFLIGLCSIFINILHTIWIFNKRHWIFHILRTIFYFF